MGGVRSRVRSFHTKNGSRGAARRTLETAHARAWGCRGVCATPIPSSPAPHAKRVARSLDWRTSDDVILPQVAVSLPHSNGCADAGVASAVNLIELGGANSTVRIVAETASESGARRRLWSRQRVSGRKFANAQRRQEQLGRVRIRRWPLVQFTASSASRLRAFACWRFCPSTCTNARYSNQTWNEHSRCHSQVKPSA